MQRKLIFLFAALALCAGPVQAQLPSTPRAKIPAVTTIPFSGNPVDRSGTITAGGTSQIIMGANTARVYFEIQNISDTTMYINFNAAAVVDSNSFKILAGGSYSPIPGFCPTGTITAIGATTGKKFVAKEY